MAISAVRLESVSVLKNSAKQMTAGHRRQTEQVDEQREAETVGDADRGPGQRDHGTKAEEHCTEDETARKHQGSAERQVEQRRQPLGEQHRPALHRAQQDDAQRSKLGLAGDHVPADHSRRHGQHERDQHREGGERHVHAVAASTRSMKTGPSPDYI